MAKARVLVKRNALTEPQTNHRVAVLLLPSIGSRLSTIHVLEQQATSITMVTVLARQSDKGRLSGIALRIEIRPRDVDQ